MPFFRVLVEGSNLCVPAARPGPPIAGFFTTRVVWAADTRAAQDKALRAVRQAWETGGHASQPTSGQLELVVSETTPSSFRRWLRAPNRGHAFFPAEQAVDAPSAMAAD